MPKANFREIAERLKVREEYHLQSRVVEGITRPNEKLVTRWAASLLGINLAQVLQQKTPPEELSDAATSIASMVLVKRGEVLNELREIKMGLNITAINVKNIHPNAKKESVILSRHDQVKGAYDFLADRLKNVFARNGMKCSYPYFVLGNLNKLISEVDRKPGETIKVNWRSEKPIV